MKVEDIEESFEMKVQSMKVGFNQMIKEANNKIKKVYGLVQTIVHLNDEEEVDERNISVLSENYFSPKFEEESKKLGI